MTTATAWADGDLAVWERKSPRGTPSPRVDVEVVRVVGTGGLVRAEKKGGGTFQFYVRLDELQRRA